MIDHAADRQLALLQQVGLVSADFFEPKLVGKLPEIACELLDGTEMMSNGVIGVITTVEFLQHHVCVVGSQEPPCDPHTTLAKAEEHPPSSVRRGSGLVLVGHSEVKSNPTAARSNQLVLNLCDDHLRQFQTVVDLRMYDGRAFDFISVQSDCGDDRRRD